jgi:endo-1,4-beta-D-glucanase Y
MKKRVYIAGRSDASLKALYPQYPKENWLSACENTRQRSSATDADLDMAAALVIASYKSSDNAQYYRTEAAKMIKAIIEYDCTDNLNGSPRPWFIKNGSQWGGFDEKKFGIRHILHRHGLSFTLNS